MSEPLSPLDPGLRAELRTAAPVPTGARERVRARLAAALPELGRGPAGRPPARGDGESAPRTGLSAVGSIATFIAGGISGAALFAALSGHAGWPAGRSRQDASLGGDVAMAAGALAEVLEPVSGAGEALSHSHAIPEVEGPRMRRRGDTLWRAPAGPAASRFSVERSLLDEARSGILQNEPGRALERLERHRLLFPEGLLIEEREAMRVEALVLAKRYDEARAAASSFRARSPGSLFLSTVESATGAIP